MARRQVAGFRLLNEPLCQGMPQAIEVGLARAAGEFIQAQRQSGPKRIDLQVKRRIAQEVGAAVQLMLGQLH